MHLLSLFFCLGIYFYVALFWTASAELENPINDADDVLETQEEEDIPRSSRTSSSSAAHVQSESAFQSTQTNTDGTTAPDELPQEQEKINQAIQQLSPECEEQLRLSQSNVDITVTDKCRLELQQNIRTIFGSDYDQFVKNQKMKAKLNTQPKPTNKDGNVGNANEEKATSHSHKRASKSRSYVIGTILGFIFSALVGLVGLCTFISKRLNDSGYYNKQEKKMTKKRAEKLRMKESRRNGATRRSG